jgi:hypothetical protein
MNAKGKKGENTSNNRRLFIVSIVIMIALILSGLYFYLLPKPPTSPKAAIIDQLGSSQLSTISRYENQSFINSTMNLLNSRFTQVDYYSDNATVENYKRLSSLGYRIIIWRAHSAIDNKSKYIAISTTETYGSTNYNQYLSNGQLTVCQIVGDSEREYIGITPKFIQEIMTGRFEDTVIILMSCNGLKTDYYSTAQALVAKGAKVIVSWDGWIEKPDNDQGITIFLQHLLGQNSTIEEAVTNTPKYYFSFVPCTLKYWPDPEMSNYHIPYYRQANSSKAEFIIAVAVSSSNISQDTKILRSLVF